MFIDLDGFKAINDQHGHDVGDQILQMVARRLEGMVRGADTVSRRSGDEFLFLMLEVEDEASATELAGRIAAKIRATHGIGGVNFDVKASIGIAMFPEDGSSAEQLLKSADIAMYAAKQQKLVSALYSASHPSAPSSST
jgi:diguanylate cyclase (GGDEF)-like protein